MRWKLGGMCGVRQILFLPLGIFDSYVSLIQNKIFFGTLRRILNLTNLAVTSWAFSCLLSPDTVVYTVVPVFFRYWHYLTSITASRDFNFMSPTCFFFIGREKKEFSRVFLHIREKIGGRQHKIMLCGLRI